jgi:hypothetical protein
MAKLQKILCPFARSAVFIQHNQSWHEKHTIRMLLSRSLFKTGAEQGVLSFACDNPLTTSASQKRSRES